MKFPLVVSAVMLLLVFNLDRVSGQSILDDIFSPARLAELRQTRLHHVSSTDTTGANDDYVKIPAGKTVTILNARGPGAIARIWMTVGSSDPYYLRRILLRMYWDGEPDPSVEVPLGDFFGSGFGDAHYSSLFVGITSGGFFCYFPMPFDSLARIDVVNETGRDVQSFYYNIDYQEFDHRLPLGIGYFHSCWHRDIRTTSKDNFLILEAHGQGQFVGCNLNLQGYDRTLSFLEGDEMIFVDGEEQPSVRGTGTEDFFNSGWYFNRGEFSAPYHGLISKVDSLSRIAAYRFMVGDAIPFRESIRVTIEHGTENTVGADYAGTAYWYQREPHARYPAMVKPGLRIPLRVTVPAGAIEAESLGAGSTNLQSGVEDMTDLGSDWSGGKQLKVVARKPGDSFEMDLPLRTRGRVSVDVYFTKGPDYGNADISVDGKNRGRITGYANAIVPGGSVRLGEFLPKRGSLPMKFLAGKKAEISTGYAIGIDAIVVQPVKKFVQQWSVIGPFPNPTNPSGARLGLDEIYPPEKQVDLKAAYSGSGGQLVRWRLAQAAPDGLVNLGARFSPNELVVGYAVAYVRSPRRQELPLLLGSDDGVKVFLNGTQVFRKLKDRPAVADEDGVLLDLKKGWNTLLLKIENGLAGYGFYARMDDPEETLEYRGR